MDVESRSSIWMTLWVLALAFGIGFMPRAASAEDPEAAEAADEAEAPPVPAQLADPRQILEDYPPLAVSERIPVLEEEGLYPCSDCHDGDFVVSNPTVRVLEEMHDEIELSHGGGRFWCLTCHHPEDRDTLTSLKAQTISFDESFLLCGQCHYERQRDFFTGAHGKRLGGWQGERTIEACTGCHNPHTPAIEPQKPFAPPAICAGLSAAPDSHHAGQTPWEKRAVEEDHVEASDGH